MASYAPSILQVTSRVLCVHWTRALTYMEETSITVRLVVASHRFTHFLARICRIASRKFIEEPIHSGTSPFGWL